MTTPARCPTCRARLVFVAIVVNGGIYKTWQCSCAYADGRDVPGNIAADIERARGLADGSVTVNEIRQRVNTPAQLGARAVMA
jgi:hypothetical protein